MNVKRPQGPSRLAGLLHHRWAVPILAELQQTGGAKYITFQRRLGIGRDSLRRTLDDLIGRDLVMRNPGYGHPLRPEYILTAAGRRCAPLCDQVMAHLAREGVVELALKKWSLPVLLALGTGRTRFSELGAALPAATPRALTLTLKELDEADLIERRVLDARPPRAEYRLAPRVRKLVPVLRELAATSR